jgi:hypothetical protein
LGIGEIMEYTVTSSTKVCGKVNGEKLTQDDIIRSGGSVEHLLASGHIKKAGQTPKAVKEEVKEEVQVQKEEPQAFVFNKYNNEGDK